MSGESKVQTQFRVVLGKEGMDALEAAVVKINEGFTAGMVSKSDLATFVFRNLKRYLSKAEIARIRDEHFDERVALDNLVRGLDADGTIPEELRKLLKDRSKAGSVGPKQSEQDESV